MDSNLFWCIIGIIGGAIFSLIITVIFYIVGKTRKRISYSVKTSCLISSNTNKINDLEIKYNNKKIDSLYLSRIKIKNTGNTIIEKSDFPTTNPLTVNSLKFTLNSDDFKYKTYLNEDNNVECSLQLPSPDNYSQLLIDFDYIPKHGLISFSVLHTDKIFIKGELKDGAISKKYTPSKEERYAQIIVALISALSTILIITVLNKIK